MNWPPDALEAFNRLQERLQIEFLRAELAEASAKRHSAELGHIIAAMQSQGALHLRQIIFLRNQLDEARANQTKPVAPEDKGGS